MPAQAGIQEVIKSEELDSRFHGNDREGQTVTF
jgi:hypothetical protein